MKLIITEGGDRLGKSTLIEGLCRHFNYDNVTIRHFGKPPKTLTSEETLKFQFSAFNKEMKLFDRIYTRSIDTYTYYPEIMIWNRSHLGEYVYSQMFRNGNPEVLRNMLCEYERGFISHDVYLITLTADSNFFNTRESDGNELSKTLDQKTKELELFKEAHEFSTITNKHLLRVDQQITELYYTGPTEFRPKEDILKEVIDFIK